jgi:hypothetical protein
MKELHISQQVFDALRKEEKINNESPFCASLMMISSGTPIVVSSYLPFKRKKELPKNKIKRFWRWFRVKVLRREELTEMVHCIEHYRKPILPYYYGPIVAVNSDFIRKDIKA